MNRYFYLGLSVALLVSCSDSTNDQPLGSSDIQLKKIQSCKQLDKATEVTAPSSCLNCESNVAQTSAGGSSDSSPVLGETNIQTEGVDELDIAKADGDFIYLLNTKPYQPSSSKISASIAGDYYYAYSSDLNSRVRSLRRTPANQAGEVDEITVKGQAKGLFITENELIAITQRYQSEEGYRTLIHYLKRLSNGTIQKIGSRRVDGMLVTARLIGSRLHLVVTKSINKPSVDHLVRTTYLDVEEPVHSCEDVRYEPAIFQDRADLPRISQLACVLTVDTDHKDLRPEGECVANASGSVVYASKDNIFIASSGWYNQQPIHAFRLADGKAPTQYRGSVLVDGIILNQFSMDEHNSHLRVAATAHDWMAGGEEANSITIARIQENGLKKVAKLDGLGKNEKIYSVRFMGDRGYMVTFKKVDPLFSIDLANPLNPQVKGELKIPGFSNYLHPMQDGYLLAIGKDTEVPDQGGDFAWFQGVAMSIFDVTDLNAPELAHKIAIGSRGTNSEALYDHKAYRYVPEKGIVVVPIDLYEGGSGQNNYGTYSHSGFHVYSATIENGFNLLAESVFASSGDGYWYGTSVESRSFFNNNILGLIGGGEFTLHSVGNPAPVTQIFEMSLED